MLFILYSIFSRLFWSRRNFRSAARCHFDLSVAPLWRVIPSKAAAVYVDFMESQWGLEEAKPELYIFNLALKYCACLLFCFSYKIYKKTVLMCCVWLRIILLLLFVVLSWSAVVNWLGVTFDLCFRCLESRKKSM